uniref:uncharacterized protein LOC122579154 n=1 Tax=Erigeron canadensis TaxID=72917 RepID=UPI001CB88DF1|nr:uncharacterized protein LOC122579154 [Erigeron canadensis]XP_043607202.1 uncharacterized protein LOC122579154 [Erigeron canadensis]
MEVKQDFLEVKGKENGDGLYEENQELNDEKNDGQNDEEKDGKESPEFSFTFKFPTYEEFTKKQKDFGSISQLVDMLEPPSCVDDKNLSKNIDSFEVSLEGSSEVDVDSNEGNSARNDDFEDEANVNEQVMVESFDEKVTKMEDKEEVDAFSEVKLEKVNDESVDSYADVFNMDSIGLKIEEKEEIDTFSEDKQKVLDGSVCTSSDSNTDLNGSSDSSPSSNVSQEDGFLSDEFFDLEFIKKDENKWLSDDFLSEKDFGTNLKKESTDDNGKNSSSDTSNKLESLWEHQELIEQLTMEIKKAKASGLPTIFEESESPPKIMEELKPWKIEEVYQHSGGKLTEAHKFYKSYREKMRKLDIFNYQKMYTIGFLQLKDPNQSSSSSKASIPQITTLLSQSFTTYKGKKREDDPTIKFIKELQNDLEVVYVSQMCLSWEILHWQYEKAMDIWESDPHLFRRFNDLAGEFQQFQVLMQRFIEDEPFQGPRVQHYVKTRCIYRNLLQVPVIRDDPPKNWKARDEVVYDITSDTLVEIFQESIRLFWQFVRADKYKRQTPAEFRKPEDAQLYMDLQKDLHKKEKKLKEVLRSGNCILKKLRSCKEEETAEDGALYFFCQVDMKLVSRVLQMSTLTSDQLLWCHNKLSRVSFVNRKIHVELEPSFLLFPC